MKLPAIHGFIDRRMLINFTVEPEVMQKRIPAPFRPKLYRGKAIAGICIIRLKHIKVKGLPDCLGVSSENGAHRIAVEWNEANEVKEGVYVPRRDTSLKLNTLVGGRIFPGKHHLAKFQTAEEGGKYHIAFRSEDKTSISIEAIDSDTFSASSIFETLENASSFFEKGAVGYSPNKNRFEGLQLKTYSWQMKPLEVKQVRSSFFEDKALFPAGSVKFDNALLMKNIEHEWHTLADKQV